MKKIRTKGLILIVFIATLLSSCASGPSVKHVVLISLDGSRPEFYMDTTWPAPHLQKLKNEGVYAAKGIESVFPSITYPSHTAIITGAYPIHHGVYYNKPFEHRPGHGYWYAGAIKTETLWKAVRKAGLTSGSVYWPLTVGAPVNYLIPIRRPEEGEKGTQLTVTIPYIRPRSLLNEFERETGKKLIGYPHPFVKKDYRESKNIAVISNYIIKKYKPNFMAIHFVGMDHQEHAHGTDAPQVRDIVRVTDSLVGTVIQAIKDAGIWKSTAIIITGDHGHTDTKASFAPNVYLKGHGLIKADSWKETISKGEWKAKFQPAGGSAFLYLKDPNDQATLDSVVSILKNTPEYKAGDFRILDRATLDKMGGNPNTPIALAPKEGITISSRVKGKTFETYKPPYHHSTHGYDPAYPSMHTTFIAVGAGIGKHKNITGMGLIDIAPVIAYLLDLDFKAPDGHLPSGILKEE